MNQSIGELFELYLQRSDLRPASVRFKRRAMSYFVEWFGDVAAGRVSPATAEDYRTILAKGRSKRSANGYLANLKPFFKWLRRHGYIEQDPFDGLRLYRVTESPKETFIANELGRLISVSNTLWRVRICLGLLGCRRGEMLNLHVSDIQMNVPNPHILLRPKMGDRHAWRWALKDHAIRYVALPEQMAFQGITVYLHEDMIRLISGLNGQPYVCIEPNYYRAMVERMQRNVLTDVHAADPTGNFQRMFRALQSRARIVPAKRYHELRAAFATAMIEHCGVSRTADALGHSSVQTTRGYDRQTAMALVAEARRMAEKCYLSNVP